MDVDAANRAIAEGRLKVERIPPAYLAPVNGAKPLVQGSSSSDPYKSPWSAAYGNGKNTKERQQKLALAASKRKKRRQYVSRLAVREMLLANPGLTINALAKKMESNPTAVGEQLRFDRERNLCWSTEARPKRWYPGSKPE